jgi:hypothetical protein
MVQEMAGLGREPVRGGASRLIIAPIAPQIRNTVRPAVITFVSTQTSDTTPVGT